jgi:SAM-dependent methyltransferase
MQQDSTPLARMGRSVTARIMDARQLAFPDSSFDAVLMHLILAVMPEPERGLTEAVRVLKPGGRIAVFDKFLRDEERPSLKRRLLNSIAKPLFSDLNRRLGPLLARTRLLIEHDEPVAFGGTYRAVNLKQTGDSSRLGFVHGGLVGRSGLRTWTSNSHQFASSAGGLTIA